MRLKLSSRRVSASLNSTRRVLRGTPGELAMSDALGLHILSGDLYNGLSLSGCTIWRLMIGALVGSLHFLMRDFSGWDPSSVIASWRCYRFQSVNYVTFRIIKNGIECHLTGHTECFWLGVRASAGLCLRKAIVRLFVRRSFTILRKQFEIDCVYQFLGYSWRNR